MSISIERAVMEDRDALRKEFASIRKEVREHKQRLDAAGLKVVRTGIIGNSKARKIVDITEGNAGFAIRVNGKVVFTSRSMKECVGEAYVRRLISRGEYIELLKDYFRRTKA